MKFHQPAADLAWELLTIMLEPEVLAPVLHDYGYLPTQKSIGEGPYSKLLNSSIPYYEERVSLYQMHKIGLAYLNIQK
jgi:multiple sugar transport system substrate-binding protein